MSPISGYLTPEARATIDAVFAKLAAPGMCNPADDEPCISGTPSHAAIQGDTRSAGTAQPRRPRWLPPARCWPPATSVNTTAYPHPSSSPPHWHELEKGAGRGLTGGGTLLPMSDVIRLGSHAHHYLAIFDNGKALALYHTKRLASPAQRIVLHARDRGCTFPGCTIPGYLCQVHHCDPYRTNPVTDVNQPRLWLRPQPRHSPNKAGPPAKTAATKPNGSHPHTSTEDNPAPTPSTTPKNSYAQKTTTRRHSSCRRAFGGHTVPP